MVSFEPSILNVIIGLFNLLINGVIHQVNVIPFAVISSLSPNNECNNMLVDYMKIPLRSCKLDVIDPLNFDFVKVDIEGYEFELLSDPLFIKVVKISSFTHFELHLGHLIKRDIDRDSCVSKLKNAKFNGIELYSQADMFDFISNSNRDGFFSFVIN